MLYRIAVRRRFLPLWKIYQVIGHQTEVLGDSARLILTFNDGLVQTVPGIHKRAMRVYPEYQQQTAAAHAQRGNETFLG